MNNTNTHNGLANHHSHKEDNFTPETIIIINCVLNAPLMLISILGNALVLAAIIRTPSIRSTHMIMLCSLTVSDFLVGLVAQPIYIAERLTKNSMVNKVSKLTVPSLCIVSLMTITAITVDRFLALHYHMRYATLVTESRVKYTLIIIWLISFPVSGSGLWNERVFNILVGIVILFCLEISSFSYIRIYRIVRRHHLQIHSQQQAVQSFNARNNTARLKKSAMNTFVFYIVLNACYLPLYILSIRYGTSEDEWQSEWDFAYSLVFSNSSINPILYCWRLRDLRRAVVKTAKQMLCKQTEEY